MHAYQNANGGVIHSVREYDISGGTPVKEGQLVKLTEGLVVPASAGETTAILGVAAEEHTGHADALNPRANGTKIMVMDAPDAICASPAPVVEATGGTTTTITATTLGVYTNDDFNGGYIKLVEKAPMSTNTDAVGTVKRIKDYGYSGGTSTFTVDVGGTPVAGDKYAIFPPFGLKKGNLSDAGLVLTTVAELPIKVVGRNEETDEILTMAVKHQLANGI